MYKKESNLIIKLAKQVDKHTKEIKNLNKHLIDKQVNKHLDKKSIEMSKNKIFLNDSCLNIKIDFNHIPTIEDKKFIDDLSKNLFSALKIKDVKSFYVKFEK